MATWLDSNPGPRPGSLPHDLVDGEPAGLRLRPHRLGLVLEEVVRKTSVG